MTTLEVKLNLPDRIALKAKRQGVLLLDAFIERAQLKRRVYVTAGR